MINRRSFLAATAGFIVSARVAWAAESSDVPENLDHLILGCRDLDEGILYLEKASGYRAAFGGSHPGRGTCNALLKIGSHSYLEILAPDPKQKELTWHKELRSLTEPLLVGYAIRKNNLEQYAAELRQRGIAYEGPTAGSRLRPDGQLLRWKTLAYNDDREGLLPFFIEWNEHSAHPSSTAPGALALLSFHRTGTLLEETTPPPGKQKALHPEKPVQLRAQLKGKAGEFTLVSKSIPSETWIP